MIIKKLERSGRMTTNNIHRTYLGFGALAMTVGIMTSQFAEHSSWEVFGGVLLGISMVLNIAGIVGFGKARRIEFAQSSPSSAI